MKDKSRELLQKSRSNNQHSNKIIDNSLLFSNIWTTLLAPIVIGLGVSYAFSVEPSEIPHYFYLLAIIFVIVHYFCARALFENSKKFSLYSEAIELEKSYSKEITTLRNELAHNKQALNHLSDLYSNQRSALFISAFSTDQAVGNFKKYEESIEADEEKYDNEKLWSLIETHLTQILNPIVLERENLFKYNSKSLYNLALYFYNGKQLDVVLRNCDSRLPMRNRSWKPGHGHVGLAFLHKEAKLCPDIQLSNELSTSENKNDANYYRSFLSIPILRCDDDGNVNNNIEPLGVLVLTSAEPNQFDQQRDLLFLTTISKHLAIYLDSVESFIKHHSFSKVENEKDSNDEK